MPSNNDLTWSRPGDDPQESESTAWAQLFRSRYVRKAEHVALQAELARSKSDVELYSRLWNEERAARIDPRCRTRQAVAAGLIDLESAIQDHVQKVLETTRGQKSAAARLLGIPRAKLVRILKRGPYANQMKSQPHYFGGGQDKTCRQV